MFKTSAKQTPPPSHNEPARNSFFGFIAGLWSLNDRIAAN
jgi:hypothetical protein